ncbi:DISARM system SNF2-like helicase DrmD [Actinoplanes sp. GCM10030250]|uniref:DISARM system SNF2-like helicase DrmD n=1 Tax=Actinoplanes sp. GCM10030250 TaxID=3273376 RepID=UPI00362451CF
MAVQTMSPVVPAVPDPGQIVEVRGSTWAVAHVVEQSLPRSPADESAPVLDHAVTLQALDEDRLGEELTVIWELEVGHTITPAQGLPVTLMQEAFDDPHDLAGFVDAMRWGAVTSADDRSFQSPFRSGVSVEAYQLEPLRRALAAPRTNLLLADDVGLGKTVEAGLVVQELLLRHRARTAIIVCPPSLSVKWQDEMRDKFGLGFVIVNSEMMREARRAHGLAANPFRIFPRVIVSMAWLPQLRAQRLLRDMYAPASRGSAHRYAFDILVVDEAHHVAPSSPPAPTGARGYAIDTLRTTAVRALADRCEHRLFLSATPHNGHPESFTALLEMVDPRRFQRGARLDPKALDEVTVRRLKSDLPEMGFPPRTVETIGFTPSDDEQARFAELDAVLRARKGPRGGGGGGGGDITAMLLKKRFMSSPWAFGTTLTAYLQNWDGSAAALLAGYDEILGADASDEEEGLWEQDEATALRQGSPPGDTRTLERLARWGLEYENRADSRLGALIARLDEICRPAGAFNEERVVVFTEYADTADWLERILDQHGYGKVLAVIQGSTPSEDRELIRTWFSADPSRHPVRVLLATDAAGEGIDLQRRCHRLINFDIPFNPSRLEQRIGRVDRYGQAHPPEVFHFVPRNTSTTYAADMSFMARVAGKVAQVARDLGSVNEVIGAEIQQHYGAHRPTPAPFTGVDANEVVNRVLKGSRELNVRLTELARGYADSKAGLHLRPANLRRVVDTALRINNQPQLFPSDEDGVYEVGAVSPAWQQTLVGLDTKLDPGRPRPFTFDDEQAKGRDDIAYVHLGHPLVAKAQRLLRRSLWSAESPLNRVTAVVVRDLPESVVAAVTRMVLVGQGGVRLHEEIFLAAVRLHGGRAMARERAEAALDLTLDAPRLKLASKAARRRLAAQWNQANSPLRTRLEESIKKRAGSRHTQVTGRLARRQDSDAARAQEIFAAFRHNLIASLEELTAPDRQTQLSLIPEDPDQQRQRQRDIEAMRRREAELSDEEAREIAAIEARYTDIKPHTTAAALIFALTPEDAAS